jgi:hypothetical protein
MVGRIWLLSDPRDDRFASAVRIGTWEKKDGKDVRVSPLVLEWERGSYVVPDFLWPSFEGDVAVQERVFRELRDRFGGIDGGPVEIIPPKWKRRKRKTSEDDSLTIWSKDLHLVDVRIVHDVDIDWERSCIKRIHQDGKVLLEVEGGERTEVIIEPEIPAFATRRIARAKGGGIFVKASLLQEHWFFKVNQFPVWNLCADSVRDFMLEKRYTNIDFFEVGELF